MNKKIAETVRNPHCQDCKLHHDAQDVCVVLSGSRKAEILIVGKQPNSAIYQANLEADLEAAGIDPKRCAFTSAIKCRGWDMNVSKGDIKACKKYLDQEIDLMPNLKWILSLGNEALGATTGHSGVMKYRARLIDHRSGATVIPTISPSAVQRNPGQRQSYLADLRFFAAQIGNVPAKLALPRLSIIDTKPKLRALKRLLEASEVLSFDIETYSSTGDEFGQRPRIISLAGTCLVEGETKTWALPLMHKDSPWRTTWKSVLRYIGPALSKVPKRVAHNGKFDCRWLRQYDVPIDVTFDTMLAAHLLDENRLKGLKMQATSRFGVEQWALDAKDLRNHDLKEVLKYNALDTYYTYHLYLETRKELVEQPRLMRIFVKLLMPANVILTEVERRGVWMDREKLASHCKIGFDMRDELERQLAEFLPDPGDEGWPSNAKGKVLEVNWNPSNFLRWFLFTYRGLPVIRTGKVKDDGSEGAPSVAEDVMLELKNYFNNPPEVRLLLERSKWQKYCSAFLSAYQELLDDADRIHTTFKLYGTVTGRLSSGKADADKVSGRPSLRGVNLQQVPRDPFIRGLFGSPPGYTFVEADFSQVELRVVAYLSRDRTMLHLYQTGQDIHRATASWVMGKPPGDVTSEDRKKAKAINFGFVYGMGARKFVSTAFEKYELEFSEDEAQDIRRAFFAQFTGLLPWHARQRRLVREYARVQSPLGRIRHLPDIESADQFVRAEAERQAINSPVQSFASDMTMISMILIEEQFRALGVRAHFISTVHDALLFEIHDDDVAVCLPIIKGTMENLPLKKKFGVDLDVPIIADLKVGRYWGESREVSEEEVRSWPTG